jgi:hypothetical protein
MNVVKAILGAGGALGGLVGVATGFGEAVGEGMINLRSRSMYGQINSLEGTVELAKDGSAMLWKPVLYGSIGAAMGVTFPISLPIAHTLYEDYKIKKRKEEHELWIEILKSDDI